MQKSRRIGLIISLVMVGLGLGGYFGLKLYLRSDSVKELAAAKLTEKLGGDVRVTEMTSDFSSTTMQVELPGLPSEPPLIKGSLYVDVSPLGLAAGSTPKVVRIDNAALNVHLDQNGNILGKLPKPPGGAGGALPEISLKGATVRIAQDGRPPFQMAGVDVKVTEANSKLTIVGSADDPELGKWKANGDWATDGSSGGVTLETVGAVRVTPQKLKSIPYIPPETWENVELDGVTPAKVTLSRGADAKWNWRVECEPTGTRLKVSPIDLEVSDTAGKVVVEGAKVYLTGVQGKTADGQIQADATLDFDKKPTRLEFKVRATNLDVKKTPASWGLAKRVDEGRMNGRGDIALIIADGQVRPEGKGKAVIKGKAFGGEAEVTVFLTGDGKRLQFSDADPTTRLAPNPARDLAILQSLVATLLQPPVAQPPVKPADPQYVRANLKLRDVDIAELIAKGNLASPVKVAGKVTLDVSAEIPIDNASSLKFYRAKGQLSAPTLQIEELTLAGVIADVELRDGVLKLTKFSAEFPKGTGSKAGSFSGTASFGIEPRTELIADLKLDEVPLGSIFAAIPGLRDKADGALSGAFHLKIPGDKFSDLKSYEADGKLTSTGITVFGQKAEKLSVQVALKNGVAELTKVEADIYSGTVSGDAKLPLIGEQSGGFKVAFKGLDTAALVKAIPNSPVKLAGKVDGKLDGTLPSFENFDAAKIVANLDLDSTKLVVQGIPTTKLTGKLGYKPGLITYDLKGGLSGGSFEVDGSYPLGGKADPNKSTGGTVRIDRVRLDRLGREMRIATLEPLRGIFSLTLKYAHGADGPTGSGRVEIRDFGWGDDLFDTTDLVSEIRINADGFEIPTVNGGFAGGTLRGRVKYDFDDPKRSLLTLKLDNADAATLVAPLGLRADTGRISVSVRSTIGKEFRGSGSITAMRVKVEGVEISELRVPLAWQFSPGGLAALTVRDATGTLANGRIAGRAEVAVNGSAKIDGRLEFVDVNVGDLAKGFGSSSYGIGKTTGRFDFSGDDVRTAADLKGTLTAKFGQTTVREIPILGSISPLLSPVQSLTKFDSGELQAQLGSGLFRIDRLFLASPGAKLFAGGSVSLGGRLDLEVVYNTGNIGPSAPLLRLFLRDIPAIGPIPVGLIVGVTEALSNRIVRLRVEGTTDRPNVRVNAANLLSENAVRFFVGQYVPLSSPTK